MKTVSKLILSLGLIAAPLAALAAESEKAYLESYRGRPDTPVPVKAVMPRVDREYAGTTVKLTFVVDAKGVPQDISVPGEVPASLANELTDALAQWKFIPLLRDGKPVASKVVLPFKVVDSFESASKLAAN
ncbi:MAG: energy transducer TonB [Opitutae bacterium]|nr:energy transducer TonB [Opitutae bacterium]